MEIITPAHNSPASSPIFPADPKPRSCEIGSLADQFRVIEAFLALPDSLRNQNLDLCRSIVCHLFKHRKELV